VVGILAVALVVLIIYRLTTTRDRPLEESSAWQAGPVLPGTGIDYPAGAAPTSTPTRAET
jgi:hypothetical protein